MPHVLMPSRLTHTRSAMITSIIILVMSGVFDLLSQSSFVVKQASARPLSLSISEVSAPHPKHCLDERQWRSPQTFSPYNLFDRDVSSVWQLCGYAIQDPGYTVTFTLAQPIEIDGFILKQVLKQTSVEDEKGSTQRKKRRRKREVVERQERGVGQSLKRFKRLQIIFFNSEISQRYPIYFQEIKFDNAERVALEYRKMMAWNPILIGDSLFDERRRALGLDSRGIRPPIKVDKVGFVFWDYEGEGEPPALSELVLTLKGERYQINQVAKKKSAYGQRAGKLYDLLTRDYMLIGDDRAMIFSRSGTIWGMEGEEENAKVMGAWRFLDHRIEVDLSTKQQGRTSARRRAQLEKRRKDDYQPLHLIVDEGPGRIYILGGPLAGEYDATRAPVPTEVLEAGQDETAPPFEAP